MGSGSSKHQAVGYWFTSGRAICENSQDAEAIQKGIKEGRYILAGETLPENYELCFMLTDGNTIRKYAHRMSDMKIWLMRNKSKIVLEASHLAGASGDDVHHIAEHILPILIDQGKDAAKLHARKLGFDQRNDRIIDALDQSLHSLSHGAGNSVGIKTGRGEMHSHAYHRAAKKAMATVEGGCDTCGGMYFGAGELDLASVKDYSNSVNSKVKSQIIDELIAAAAGLNIKAVGNDHTEKIKSLLAQIPSGQKFSTASDVQQRACVGIAKAINNAHGSKIIDPELAPEIVCQQVAEVLSSLAAGSHTEFLVVYNDVRKVIKNLHILKNALRDEHKAVTEKIKLSADESLPQQLASLDDLHKMLLDEVDRQISMLTNLLNIHLAPAERDLAALLSQSKDLHSYIEKIDVKTGNSKFGTVIANLLKGLGVTASLTLLIEKALKTVGMTLDDYTKSGSIQKLKDHLARGVMDKKLDDSQLHDYLEAADLLYKNFYRSHEIAEAKSGAAEPAREYAASTMDKRVADRKKLRGLIFNAFYHQINAHFDQFVSAIDILTAKVGREIPLSEQLEQLRRILQRVDQGLVRKHGIYHALIGYYNDAMSKSKKEAFIGELQMVSKQLEIIMEMPMYAASKQYFAAVNSHILAIIQLIDKYSDEITAKFGRGEEHNCVYLEESDKHPDDNIGDEPHMVHDGAFEFTDAVYGGDDLTTMPTLKYRSTKTINDAIRQFDYHYRVAQIHSNLQATGKELDHYAEKYEKLVANSVADVLESKKIEYEKLRKELLAADAKLLTVVGSNEFADDSQSAGQKAAAESFLDAQWDAKKKFWATVEAVDTYMRLFTNGIVKNPNDIKEIKSMLDSVEIINDWYDDKTGNDMAAIFDFFPSAIDKADGNATYPPESYSADGGENHYYQKIAAELNAGTVKAAAPGNPHLVASPMVGKKAMDQVKKTMNGLSILKNLLSVFVHIGQSFGGQELRKQLFMTPAQMYNNLVDYLQASAFAQGFGTGKMPAGAGMPEHWYDGEDSTVKTDTSVREMKAGLHSANMDWTPVPESERHLREEINKKTRKMKKYIDAQDGFIDFAGYANAHMSLERDNRLDTARMGFDGQPQRTDLADEPLDMGTVYEAADKFDRNRKKVHKHKFDLSGTGTPNNKDNAFLFRKRWGVWMRSVRQALKDREGFGFDQEDKMFVLVMKSLAAKILTVVGTYDVFDRPMEYNGLSPIRMILGGSQDTPQVDSEAVALYLRLPLLAQFYRGIFGFNDPENPDNAWEKRDELRRNDMTVKISMVPDFDGPFAGLIRLVFGKTKHIKSTEYTDDDIKEMVREINLIYQKLASKHPNNTVMEIINEFVAEVNRRYGIVSKSDRDHYEREFGHRYDYAGPANGPLPYDRYQEAPSSEIALLPGEGDEELARPSPAQKLLGESFDISPGKKSPWSITDQHRDIVYKFRCAIDKYFEDPKEEFTFNNAISAVQRKLKSETNLEARLKMVAQLMRGTDVYSKVDGMKCVLFHETVVAGLNSLSAVHSMLTRFKRSIHLIDFQALEKYIWEYLIDPTKDEDFAKIPQYIAGKLVEQRIYDKESDCLLELNTIFGRDENSLQNGGDDTGPWTIKNAPAGAPNDRQQLVTLFKGLEPSKCRAAYEGGKVGSPEYEAAEKFMQLAFDREHIMTTLIETLFAVSCDFQNLIDIKFEDGRVLMNFGNMKSHVEAMFQHVFYFMDLLRPHVSAELMERHTNKVKAGSYYWLQEQLMEKIIVGRPAQMEIGGKGAIGYASLDELAQRASFTLGRLTKVFTGDVRTHFDKVFAGLIFYDATRPQSGIAHSTESYPEGPTPDQANGFAAAGGVKPVDYLRDPYDGLHFHGPPGAKVLDTRFAARFTQLYTWKNEFTMNRSALFSFNQLLAKFLQAFYDPVSNKIYNGLLTQFANGPFSRSVADQMYTYPDTVPMLSVLAVAGKYDVPGQIALKGFLGDADLQVVEALKADIIRYLKHVDSKWPAPAMRLSPNNATSIVAGIRTAGGADRTAMAGLIEAATRIYPFANNAIGANDTALEHNAKIFAELAVRIGKIQDDNNKLAALEDLKTSALALKTVYVPPSSNSKYLVKQDDLMIAQHDLEYVKDAKSINSNAASNFDQNFGNRMDPDGEHVLFTSLSVILKNLLNSRLTNNQSPVYLQENVADIPLYMKEKMRANLPFFRNLFRGLSSRCEFMKQFMNQSQVSLERNFATNKLADNPWPGVLNDPAANSATAKARFTGILDTVIRGCATLIGSCDQVLREVGDDPKYFETYQGSIKDYRAQYGIDPFMPLSSTLAIMKNTNSQNYLDFFPIHSLGQDCFKMMYGVRSILGQPTAKPMIEHIPGFAQIIEGFNLVTDSKLSADKTRAEEFMRTFIHNLRYIYELKHVKGLLTPARSNATVNETMPDSLATNYHNHGITASDLVNTQVTDRPTNRGDISIMCGGAHDLPACAYAISHTQSDTLRLTESSFRDERIKELVEYICVRGGKQPDLEVQNIIDLGIVPINVHALMREIPLVNLYNYAYTFDRLIIELYYGVGGDNARKLINELCSNTGRLGRIQSAKDMLVNMLLDPYMDISSDFYHDYAKKMLTGVAANGELGRPKFLSDQIYNKAIFGELYPTPARYNEVGPAAAHETIMTLDDHGIMGIAIHVLQTLLHPGFSVDRKVAAGQMFAFRKFCIAAITFLSKNSGTDADSLQSVLDKKFFTGNSFSELKEVKINGTLIAGASDVIARAAVAIWKEILKKKQNLKSARDPKRTFQIIAQQIYPRYATNVVLVEKALNDAYWAYVKPESQFSSRDIDANGAFLTWLDVNIVTRVKPFKGVGLQNSPRGDNTNVMDRNQVHSIAIPNDFKRSLIANGQLRFDTVFIRNLIFIVNLYRSIRLKLQRDLTYSKDIILRSAPITRADLTEFYGNQADHEHPSAPNAPMMERRYDY